MDDPPQTPQPGSHEPGSMIQPSAGVAQPTAPIPAVVSPGAAQSAPHVLPMNVNPPQPTDPTSLLEVGSIGATPPSSTPSKRRFGGKKLAIIAGVAILLFGAVAYTFAIYIPSTPQNLWGTSLSRMGKGYDKLSSYVQDYQSPKGYKIDGTLKLSGSVVGDGTITSTSDGSNSQTKVDISAAGVKLNFDALTLKSNSNVPDLYVKVSGLDGVGSLVGSSDLVWGDALTSLNNQWYFIDHTLLEQASASGTSDSVISKADVTQLLNATAGPTKKYIFTNNTNDMAFVIKQKIGKETQDGRNVYHYKIGIDGANLAAYEKALCKSVSKTKLYSLLSGSTFVSYPAASSQDCGTMVSTTTNKDTADVWVDTHTKLIHKVRFTDQASKSSYFDVFQDYQSGNSVPFGVGFNSKDGGDTIKGSVNFVLDMTANTLSVKGSVNATGSTNEQGTLSLTIGPNKAPVNVQKPANAKNILELLRAFQ